MSSCYNIKIKYDSFLTTLNPIYCLLCRRFKIQLVRFVCISLGMPFYAVAMGRTPGIYATWPECLNQTNGFPKAKYKKFNTELEALNFLKSYQPSIENNTSASLLKIENVNPPERTMVNTSRALLKQDKISLLANKLESFIELTNKTLKEIDMRLQKLESAVFSTNTTENKRKQDNDKSEENCSKKKKLKTHEGKKETQSIASTKAVEDVDSPFNSINSSTNGFMMDTDGHVIVYTDGACSNNGRQGAKAGLGVWFNHSNPFNVAAPIDGIATNNNAEIQAATRAITQASLAGISKLNVHTDSQFMINCMTDWIKKWKKNDWTTSSGSAVKNKEQLLLLDKAIQSMESVKWTHVRGHVGNEGNECADALARDGATMY